MEWVISAIVNLNFTNVLVHWIVLKLDSFVGKFGQILKYSLGIPGQFQIPTAKFQRSPSIVSSFLDQSEAMFTFELQCCTAAEVKYKHCI